MEGVGERGFEMKGLESRVQGREYKSERARAREREREREKERKRERNRDRQTETDRDRERERLGQTSIYPAQSTDLGTLLPMRGSAIGRDADREIEGERGRERRGEQTQIEREREAERERETRSDCLVNRPLGPYIWLMPKASWGF